MQELKIILLFPEHTTSADVRNVDKWRKNLRMLACTTADIRADYLSVRLSAPNKRATLVSLPEVSSQSSFACLLERRWWRWW